MLADTQAVADVAVKVSSWFGAKTNNDAAELAQLLPDHQKKWRGWRQALGGREWWHLLVETGRKGRDKDRGKAILQKKK